MSPAVRSCCLFGGIALLFLASVVSYLPAEVSAEEAKAPGKVSEAEKPLTVEAARERAKLLHNVYSSTLDVMHHRYFRSDHAVLPARAMEDIFSQVEKDSSIKTRWISVNTQAMSINHEPEGAFEKKAAREIATGKSDYEAVEDGVYQRAGAIPLKAGCVGCHTKSFSVGDKKPRFAALVIRIPVKDK